MYCLWLGGKKVQTVEQLRENFHLQHLCGYLLGGSLARWLEAAGDPDLADKVRGIDLSADYEEQLLVIFGKKQQLPAYVPDNSPVPAVTAASCSFKGDVGSFSAGGSFSAEHGSFSVNASSFAPSSGFFGSFKSGNNNNNNNNGGSFGTGSYGFGSFSKSLGSFSMGSFGFGSFAGSFSAGSFIFSASDLSSFSFDKYQQLEPEKKVMINLSSEPLNRYGYGIHLI